MSPGLPIGRLWLSAPHFYRLRARDSRGLVGTAVTEVNLATGRWDALPIGGAEKTPFHPKAWLAKDIVQVEDGTSTLCLQKVSLRWRRLPSCPPVHGPSARASNTRAVKIEWRQGLNDPPALYAVDIRSGRERLVFDPSPKLRTEFTIGRVENIQWKDREGRAWRGRLHYPVGYNTGQRYPLVVQTEGIVLQSDEFSLTGAGSFMEGVYAAQPLANRGMVVLQVQEQFRSSDGVFNTPAEGPFTLAVISPLSTTSSPPALRIGTRSASSVLAAAAIGWNIP